MNAIAAIEGSGDHRILVLHGWALDSSVWLTARARTDQSRFTYAYLDFPGYGVNRPEAPADGIDGMAAVALDAADQLGWSTFSVLGHSMGGTTALRVATLAPERVTSVVALTPVSPAGTPLDETTYGSFAGAWADPGAAIRGALAPYIDETDLKNLVDRNRSTMDQATWESYLKNWTSPDFLDRIGIYEGPTTLIVGESDPFVTAEYLGDTLAALKNGNLKTVHGKTGHYPMVENAPETVALSEQSL